MFPKNIFLIKKLVLKLMHTVKKWLFVLFMVARMPMPLQFLQSLGIR